MGAEDNHYDIIIIGGGSAGYAAARTALEYTQKVAVVDGSDELGGLCILKGCMPSKTLLYTADVVHSAQKGAKLGITAEKVRVDVKALQERKRELISGFAGYRAGQLQDGRFKLYRSNARFLDHLTIRLTDGTELWADKYVIANGSKVNEPSIPGLDSIGYLTSDSILAMDSLPESIVVLGGGIVACELAQYLNRAGVKVTLVQRSPYLVKEFSADVSYTLKCALQAEGISVFTDTQLQNVRRSEDSVVVQFLHEGVTCFAHGREVLNALGRIPNTSFLDLDQADVQVAVSGHIETNMMQQTTNPAIYAAGDCAGPDEIVHIAIMQGENAVHHALGGKIEEVDYDFVTKIIFTEPQIGFVGLSRTELEMRGIDFIEASYPFSDHGKSLIMDALYGHVRVFASRVGGKILGAECVGKDAGELIHTLAVAVSAGLRVQDLLKVHWYHPTLSEIWTYPLEDLDERIIPA